MLVRQSRRCLPELIYGFSSVGRALVSKTKCREFESLNPCKKNGNEEIEITYEYRGVL